MPEGETSFHPSQNDRACFTLCQGQARASYIYPATDPKACFHPLVTPKGHVLTGWMMSDHIWHRALWFTLKYINGTNYWEEEKPYGVQQSLSEPGVELLLDNTARINHEVQWNSEATGIVLTEKRLLTISTDAQGITHITWDSTLKALQPLTLDRTPFTTWGGYSGLSFRASREMHNVRFVVPGDEIVESLTGQAHDWVILKGQMDGGSNEKVSLGMIDHPENPRSPSPWYGKSNNGFTFLNAAFLFHGPMELAQNRELRFRYKIAYRDDIWPPGEFQALVDQFRSTTQLSTSK